MRAVGVLGLYKVVGDSQKHDAAVHAEDGVDGNYDPHVGSTSTDSVHHGGVDTPKVLGPFLTDVH